MEKEHEKNVYMCITESLCCAVEINTTLYINYTSTQSILRKEWASSVFMAVHLWSMGNPDTQHHLTRTTISWLE